MPRVLTWLRTSNYSRNDELKLETIKPLPLDVLNYLFEPSGPCLRGSSSGRPSASGIWIDLTQERPG